MVALKDGATPLPGRTVTWSTDNGSMTSFSTITDANGEARNTVTPSASWTMLPRRRREVFAVHQFSRSRRRQGEMENHIPQSTQR